MIFVTLAVILSELLELDVVMFIGPVMMSAILALIGAGIYTLVKKSTNSTSFTRKLKQELVSKIIKVIKEVSLFNKIAA